MASKRNIFEEVGSDTKITSASAGAIARAGSGDRHWVRLWLWSLVGLIIVMITVGGLTRLTDSGLSITEWDPVMGAIPPLSAAAWQAAFAAYQTTAEFAVQNAAMSLAEFKVIFWWEWGHRQLGRFIGLTWALGFALLFFTGKLPKVRRVSLFAIGPFIGLQGFIGWLMVHSGLDGVRLDVVVVAVIILKFCFTNSYIYKTEYKITIKWSETPYSLQLFAKQFRNKNSS